MKFEENFTLNDLKKHPEIVDFLSGLVGKHQVENFWEKLPKAEVTLLVKFICRRVEQGLRAYHNIEPRHAFELFQQTFPKTRLGNKEGRDEIEQKWEELNHYESHDEIPDKFEAVPQIGHRGFQSWIREKWVDHPHIVPQGNSARNSLIYFLNREQLINLDTSKEFGPLEGTWAAYFLDGNLLGDKRTVQRNIAKIYFTSTNSIHLSYYSTKKNVWETNSKLAANPFRFTKSQGNPNFEFLLHLSGGHSKSELNFRFTSQPNADLLIGTYGNFSHKHEQTDRPSCGIEVFRRLPAGQNYPLDQWIQRYPLPIQEALDAEEEAIFDFLQMIQFNRLISPPKNDQVSDLKRWVEASKLEMVTNTFKTLQTNYFNAIDPNINQVHSSWLRELFNILKSPLVQGRDKKSGRLSFEVTHSDQVSSFYNRILRNSVQGEEFFILTSPSTHYIWRDPRNKIERDIGIFMNDKELGLKMHRFFLVSEDKIDKLDRHLIHYDKEEDSKELGLQLLSVLEPDELEILHRHYELYGKDAESQIYLVAEPHLKSRQPHFTVQFFGLTTLTDLYWRFDFNFENSSSCPVIKIICRPAGDKIKDIRNTLLRVAFRYNGEAVDLLKK